jgi:uncharacterized membrane protein YfcA
MMKKPEFSAAYAAGREAVQRRSRYPTLLGAFFGVLIGEWLRDHYSLPWFEWGPLTALIMVLLAFLIELIEKKVRHSKQKNRPDQP